MYQHILYEKNANAVMEWAEKSVELPDLVKCLWDTVLDQETYLRVMFSAGWWYEIFKFQISTNKMGGTR